MVQVDLPVSKLYSQAVQVVVGATTRIDAEKRLIGVRIVETLKGTSVADRFNIQIAEPQNFISQVKPDQPVAVFVGKSNDGPVAVVHLADDWLMARQVAGTQIPTWRVFQKYAIRTSFSGRTAALVQLLGDLKTGKSNYLNAIEPNVFRGGPQHVASLQVRPTSFLVCDVNGDKRPDFLVGTDKGARLFLATEKGYRDETTGWGLGEATGKLWIRGDVSGDSQPELFIGAVLWQHSGNRFSAQKSPVAFPEPALLLAATLADVSGDNLPDAILLLKSGELKTFENIGMDQAWPEQPSRWLWEPQGEKPLAACFSPHWNDDGKTCVLVVRERGVTRYTLDAQNGRADEAERLTGEAIAIHHKRPIRGFQSPYATALDIDGNGLADFLYRHETDGGTYVNRGFGTFFFNPDCDGNLYPKPNARKNQPILWTMTPGVIVTAADLHADKFEELLIVTETGEVYAQENPPFPRR